MSMFDGQSKKKVFSDKLWAILGGKKERITITIIIAMLFGE